MTCFVKRTESGSCCARMSRLSDDEAIAKMGYPGLGLKGSNGVGDVSVVRVLRSAQDDGKNRGKSKG